MSRLLIVLAVVAVVLTVYAVIDCAMTDAKRTRALSKPVWLLVTLVVPLVGPLLWILFGKGLLLRVNEPHQSAPDDDEAFLSSLGHDTAHDERIRQLEEELRALDEQLMSGDVPPDRPATGRDTPAGGETTSDDDASGATAASAATAEWPSDAASKGSSTGGSAKGDAGRREATSGDARDADDDERTGDGNNPASRA